MIVGWSVLALFVAAGLAFLVVAVILPAINNSSGGATPAGCSYTDWGAWIGCDVGTPAECGDGVGVRIRGIVADGGGCNEGDMVESVPCMTLNSTTCAALNCSYTSWSSWTSCPSVTCNAADGATCTAQPTSYRTRGIAHQAQTGGVGCAVEELFEFQPCSEGVPCPPPVACQPEPWTDAMWTGCPAGACTMPGAPTQTTWEYAHRGIAVQAEYGGAECNPSDFVQSRTCAIPECTSCTILGWGAWSQCDVPCSTAARTGVRWAVADAIETGSSFWCDTTSVSACNTGACPVGAFDAKGAVGSGCTAPLQPGPGLPVTAWDGVKSSITLGDALALCGGAAACAGVAWTPPSNPQASWSAAALLASTAGCAGGPNQLYVWDAASANCIAPTWPMLDAECLNLCSGDGSIPQRGRVYPFEGAWMPDGVTPALSCPITSELLAGAGVCAPDAVGSYTSLSCPGSSDCVYQPWSDAPPWSVCDDGCGYAGGGGGTRQRTRNILAPPAFMGAACDPHQLTIQTTCNSPETFTSAVGMVCAVGGLPAKGVTASAACLTSCSDMGHACAGYSFAGADTLADAYGKGQELFAASWGGNYTSRSAIDALLASASSAGFGDWRYAALDELAAAQALGAQWCLTGFTAGSGGGGFFPMQPGFSGSGCGAAGVNAYATPQATGVGVLVGTKPTAAQASALQAKLGIQVAPFSTAGGTQTWSMPDPSTLGDGVCLLASTSMDAQLAGGLCAAGLSGLSLAADAPCTAPVPCSLTSWTDFTTCPACGPPYYKWQTRDVYAQPLNGGTPCSAFLTQQSVSCDPVPPACSATLLPTVYGPWPSLQPAGSGPCASASPTAYPESWDVPIQASWILSGAYNAASVYLDGSGAPAQMPTDLADALNAQCLTAGGGAPTCLVTRAGASYSMVTHNSAYAGWTRVTPQAPQVYFAGPSSGVALTQAAAAALAQQLGGVLATKAQLDAAREAGAQWCMGGWTADDASQGYYPMQYGVPGWCGYTPGSLSAVGPAQTEGAVIYGVKPVQGAAPAGVWVEGWFDSWSTATNPPKVVSSVWDAPSAGCTPDPGCQACLMSRPACADHQVFSPTTGDCFCPSLCPSDMSLCSFSACSAVCAGGVGAQVMTRQLLQAGTDFNPAELVWELPCTGAASLPACPNPCPIAPDGSACASASGHGSCDTATGACVCDPAYDSSGVCWFGCPTDEAGVACSGNGACSFSVCACADGYTGGACEFPPDYSVLGSILMTGERYCTSDYTVMSQGEGLMSFVGLNSEDAGSNWCVPLSLALRGGLDAGDGNGPWMPAQYGNTVSSASCAALGYSKLTKSVTSAATFGNMAFGTPYTAYLQA